MTWRDLWVCERYVVSGGWSRPRASFL